MRITAAEDQRLYECGRHIHSRGAQGTVGAGKIWSFCSQTPGLSWRAAEDWPEPGDQSLTYRQEAKRDPGLRAATNSSSSPLFKSGAT